MGDAIKIAGIGQHWDIEYAQKYKAKLEEMGFSAKVLVMDDTAVWVAYSHRYFTGSEAFDVVTSLFTE